MKKQHYAKFWKKIKERIKIIFIAKWEWETCLPTKVWTKCQHIDVIKIQSL